MLRRALLAASASSRLRQLITTAPATRAIVEKYVAGETADDAVRVTRTLRAAGLLVTLDYLGEDTKDPVQAAAPPWVSPSAPSLPTSWMYSSVTAAACTGSLVSSPR